MKTITTIIITALLSGSLVYWNTKPPAENPDQTTPPSTTTTPDTTPPEQNNLKVDNLDFGVGEGIVWEDGVFAPFADMGAWVTDPRYANGGALNLHQVMADTGIKYFNLGFINAVDSTVTDGVLNWGFAAFDVLSEDHADTNTQYQGIKKAIRDVRAAGGDVTISIGGLNERNLYQYTDDLEVLVNTYTHIIDGFNLTRIDLDIEGAAQGYETNKLNAQAMKLVQENTGVEVAITLPVLPTGLTSDWGVGTLRAYLEAGVDIKLVNIMAMCYGAYFGDYAVGSVDAMDSTMRQIIEEYQKVGITLTTQEAYNKIGVITSIGFEGEAHPIFTQADSSLVVAAAQERNINMVSYWSINRDSMTQENKGISQQYEHATIYKAFQDGSVITPITPIPPTDQTTLPEGEVAPWSRENEALGMYGHNCVVSHNGKSYLQITPNVVWWCEPGTDPTIWQEITERSENPT